VLLTLKLITTDTIRFSMNYNYVLVKPCIVLPSVYLPHQKVQFLQWCLNLEISITQNLASLGFLFIDCQHDVRVSKFRNLVIFTFVTDLAGSMCNVGA
jgi:hypothetical protein